MIQPLLTSLAIATSQPLDYNSLGLHPVALDLGFFQLRWYSLAYLVGILVGWWYLLKLLAKPGAPMARRHADDMVFYGTLGVILGGRLGYVLFYKPVYYLSHPLEIPAVWQGGMSFHGGMLGVIAACWLFCRRSGKPFWPVMDFVAPLVPLGLAAGRMGNFINGELWGRPADPSLPWAMVFPQAGEPSVPRHPSQLYQFALEGMLLFVLLCLYA